MELFQTTGSKCIQKSSYLNLKYDLLPLSKHFSQEKLRKASNSRLLSKSSFQENIFLGTLSSDNLQVWCKTLYYFNSISTTVQLLLVSLAFPFFVFISFSRWKELASQPHFQNKGNRSREIKAGGEMHWLLSYQAPIYSCSNIAVTLLPSLPQSFSAFFLKVILRGP